MASYKIRDDESIASSQARKRKRRTSFDSDHSNNDVRPRKSAANDSDTSQRNRAIKRSQGINSQASSSTLKSSILNKDRRKALSSNESSDESEEEIVVASSRKPTGLSSRPESSSKSLDSSRSHYDKKRDSKQVRLSQIVSDDDHDEDKRDARRKEASTNLFRSSLASSTTKASSSSLNRRVDSVNGDNSRMSTNGHAKAKDNSPKSFKSNLLDNYNFTSNKSPSPTKLAHTSHSTTDTQESARNRKLQNQIATLKQRWDESEDRFNEASARCETLSAQVMQLETQIKRNKRAHEESLGKIKESMDGSGDTQRLAQAQIDEYTHKLNIERNHHHEVVLDLHRQLDRARRDLQTAQGNPVDPQPIWIQRQQGRDAKRAAELEERLRSQKEQYESKIEQLEGELAKQKYSTQLADKERELEAIRVNYTQELDSRDEKYNRLKALYEMDKRAWTSSQSHAGQSSTLIPSEDIAQLQKQVSMLTKQKNNHDLHFQATIDTYEASIKRIQRAAAARVAEDRAYISSLEDARRTLDFDRSRFQGQVAALKREAAKLEEEVSNLRQMRSAYDELKEKYPKLLEDYHELEKSTGIQTKENAALVTERQDYTAKIKVLESQIDEYIALLQASKSQHGNGTDLADKYSLLKSTYSMDRQKYKRKIKKLERRLAQYGLESDNPSDRQSAPLHSASDEDQTAREAVGRKRISATSGSFRDVGVDDEFFDDAEAPPFALSRRPLLKPPRDLPTSSSVGKTKASIALQKRIATVKEANMDQFVSYEAAKPAYVFPPTLRERKADTKVPRHKSRVYVRSECHTPYVADEMVSDSDDEFLEWESEAYAKSQATNPDRKAAVVNTCWNRHILDFRCNRVRSTNLHFCIEFVESYGPLLHSRDATSALLKHILKLVDLGQLTVSEGGTIIRAYHQAV